MIPEQIPVKNHYGNNSATTFEFDFLIDSEDELVVVHTDLLGNKTVLTKNVDYSIYETSNENGSYITFPLEDSEYNILAYDSYNNKKEMLSISLNLPIKQQCEYDVSSNLNPTVLEKCFDYLTRICQIQARKIDRAIKVQEGSNINTDELSVALEKVSKVTDEIQTVSENVSNLYTVCSNIDDINTLKNNIINVINVSNISADIAEVKNNISNINSIVSGLTNINIVANSISNVENVSNGIQKISTVSGDIENIGIIATNIDNVINLSNKMNQLQSVLQEVNSIPDGVKVGLVWKEFLSTDWNKNGEYYSLTLLDMPAPIGVFKFDNGNKIFINNVDMGINGDNCILVAFEAFNGAVLGGAKIVETVESQNEILEELSAVEISEIKLSDLE